MKMTEGVAGLSLIIRAGRLTTTKMAVITILSDLSIPSAAIFAV